MKNFLKIWAYHFVAAFFCAATGYVVLHAVMPDGYVFGAPYRMFYYHLAHPFQYIGVVAVVYSCIATPLAFRCGKLTGWGKKSAILGVIFISIVAASVPGGVLWKIHDMQAGYFPEGVYFWRGLLWGAAAGLTYGLPVILLSFPFNLIGLICGYFITRNGVKFAAVHAKTDHSHV